MKPVTYFGVAAAILLLLSVVLSAASPVNAAPTPISENCEEVATIGIIEYYFCESPYGDFYANSLGFMLVVD